MFVLYKLILFTYLLIVSAVCPLEQVASAFVNYDMAHELTKEYVVTI